MLKSRSLRVFKYSALTIGVFLLLLNMAGFFVPLRNPEIYREKDTCFPNDITLTESQLREILLQSEGMADAEAIPVVADALRNGIACYWSPSGAEKYNLRVPVYENYLLYLAAQIRPVNYRMFRFCDPDKAIRRGVGYCDQHSIIFAEIFRKRGLNTGIVELSGHVIATVEVEPGKWWLVDPEFGVVIKHSLSEVEKNLDSMRVPYLEKGHSEEEVNRLMRIYAPPDNRVSASVSAYFKSWKCEMEQAAYWLKWILPVACILVFAALSQRTR